MSLLKKAQSGPSMMTKAAAHVQNDVLFGTSANFPRMLELNLDQIEPNPDQPRRNFDEGELRGLAESIDRIGLKQPILVKQLAAGRYVIAAGERRYRAHRLLERNTIFAIVTDGDIDEIALIENLQRADLDALEEARAFARLIDRHGYTHEEMGRIVARSQGEVTRTLATLRLPDVILEEFSAFRRSVSKSILQELAFIDDSTLQLALWDQAKAGKLTIRGLRETKKGVAAPRGKAATGQPVEVSNLIASAFKDIRRVSINIAALKPHRATLDDRQLAEFRRLKDLLADLLGE
jgi:ParB family transcriptional regulator, chromosome partitioning protein